MDDSSTNEARIAELEAKLKKIKDVQARKFYAPDPDPTAVFVMVETVDGEERFLRWTVSSTLSGCHCNWRNLDTFMEPDERQVRVAKVRMTEISS